MKSLRLVLRKGKGMACALMLVALFAGLFTTCVAVPATVSAADTNNTTADTLYYGLSILEWAVIALAFILLIAFFWIRNIYLFFGFIFLIVAELIVHFFGT